MKIRLLFVSMLVAATAAAQAPITVTPRVPGVADPPVTSADSSTVTASPDVTTGPVVFSSAGTLWITVSGRQGVGVAITTTGFSGTLTYGQSFDNRVSTGNTKAYNVTSGLVGLVGTGVETFGASTATGRRSVIVGAGVTDVSIVVTRSAGSVTLTLTATNQPSSLVPVFLYGIDSTDSNTKFVQTATTIPPYSDGSLVVRPAHNKYTSISFSESVAAPVAATWYVKRRFNPASSAGAYKFAITGACATVTTAGSQTLIGTGLLMGTFNVSTNVFTDGAATSNRPYSRIFGIVSTVMSAVANNITVTYTDYLGASGHATAATTVAASSPVGTAFDFLPAVTVGQERDAGIIDVTNVTDTAAPTGVIEIWGINPIFQSNGAANALECTQIVNTYITSSEYLFILLKQAATTAEQRAASVTGYMAAD